MRSFLIILVIALTVLSCKKKNDDPTVIDDSNIIGTWKRVARGTISGSDTTYTNYSETILHKFYDNNNYEEVKTPAGGYSSVAHYTYNLSDDTLRFYAMGMLSHRNYIKLSQSTLIIHIAPDPDHTVYKLEKQ
jgi:hypothetical protein